EDAGAHPRERDADRAPAPLGEPARQEHPHRYRAQADEPNGAEEAGVEIELPGASDCRGQERGGGQEADPGEDHAPRAQSIDEQARDGGERALNDRRQRQRAGGQRPGPAELLDQRRKEHREREIEPVRDGERHPHDDEDRGARRGEDGAAAAAATSGSHGKSLSRYGWCSRSSSAAPRVSERPAWRLASSSATRWTLNTASSSGTEGGRSARPSAVELVTAGIKTTQARLRGTGSETAAMPAGTAHDTVRPPRTAAATLSGWPSARAASASK